MVCLSLVYWGLLYLTMLILQSLILSWFIFFSDLPLYTSFTINRSFYAIFFPLFHISHIVVYGFWNSLSRWTNGWQYVLSSVYNGIPIVITLQLARATKLLDYGMYKLGNVHVFSLVIGVQYCHWQCLQMGGLWLLVMKMVQSWYGISQIVAASHHLWGTILVFGLLLSGDLWA